MSETNTDASGADQKSSGQMDGAEEQHESSSKDTVAYESYRKVLSEKKKRDEELKAAQEELAKLKKADKQRLEDELKQKEDYKKLLELREKEKTDIEEKFNSLSSQIQDSLKFQHFLDALPGSLPKKFWKMVDIGEIIIDPTTGEPDPVSVKKVADGFQSEFGELIVQPGKAKLPNGSAKPSTAPITKEIWASLSPKEKKERLPEYAEFLKTQQ